MTWLTFLPVPGPLRLHQGPLPPPPPAPHHPHWNARPKNELPQVPPQMQASSSSMWQGAEGQSGNNEARLGPGPWRAH